jgi:predicted DNA-binding transcriptional regulator AlpA
VINLEEFLTEKELCKKLKLARTTLYRLRKDGLPYKNIGGRSIRYDEKEVRSWIDNQTKNKGGV